MEEKKKKKRIGLKIFLGLILLVVGLFVRSVVKNVKVIQEGQEFKEIKALSEEGMYQSNYGWEMKVPGGWGTKENEFNKMEMVLPDKQADDKGWTYVAVEPFSRVAEVDNDEFLKKYEEIFLGEEFGKQFPNLKLTKGSVEGQWKGYKSFEYLFDHDFGQTRVRQLRKYLFPKQGGNGWLLYSQAKVDDWEGLEELIMETIESFESN